MKCQCKQQGFCKTHGRQMSPAFWNLCRNGTKDISADDYFDAFQNSGPKPRRLLGDVVHDALRLVGVTEERVTKWIGQPCGCSERRARLNRLQLWAEKAVKGAIGRMPFKD